jgi:signal transduction histidine kinase
MRLWVLVILALFAKGLVLPVAWSATMPLTADERTWIAAQSPVPVGISADWGPFSYESRDGGRQGIDLEVLSFITGQTGLRFEVVPTESWEQTLRLVKDGRVLVTTSTAETPERHEMFRFTQVYFQSAVVIVAREGDRRFTHVAQLRNATIAMPKKHVTTAMLRQRLPGARFVLFERQGECFDHVRKRRADATVANVFVAADYLHERPTARLAISGAVPEAGFPLRFAVRKDQAMLASLMDRALDALPQETLDEMASKHLSFHLQASSRTALFKERGVEAAVVLGGVIFLVFWRYWSLRNEVRARRRAEQQLRQLNQSLEVFSHAIAHDLKTPLRAIRGITQILCEDCRDSLNSTAKDYLARIVSATDRMDRMLRDVLSYSKVSSAETAPPKLTTVSLGELMNQLLAELPAEDRGCVQVNGNLPDVLADPTQLGQCISNLLSNALKFVPRDKTPVVKVWAVLSGKNVRLNVEDNGIGIPPADQKRIFELFQRVASQRKQTFEGTGIGLAVVARAMEKMGGTFGVESQLGHGSRFWIELPRPPQADSSAKSSRHRGLLRWLGRKHLAAES